MTQIIQKIEDSLLVSTDTIAKFTGNEHRSVYRLISNYESDFNQFGQVRFQIAGKTSIALLNEDQATLLITFLKNSEKVRQFKVALVKEFRALKESKELETPEQLMARALISAQSVIASKDAQIEAAQPAIRLESAISNDDNTLSMTEAGKKLQVKPRMFINWLSDKKYIDYEKMPYQRWINQGLLVISTIEKNGKPRSSARVTGKGFAYFGGKLSELKFKNQQHELFYK
jgi:phage regulator Rha-like protein